MARTCNHLGILVGLAAVVLVLLTRTAEPVRFAYSASQAATETAPVEGALVGAVAPADLAALPPPHGP